MSIASGKMDMRKGMQVLALIVSVGILIAVGLQTPNGNYIEKTQSVIGNGEETWAIYWYLCGSDLESNYGSATKNLQQMARVKLPSNVKLIIETGGAKEWHNQLVDAEHTVRLLYNQNGLKKLEELPSQNMGKSDTLTDFLLFCKEKYPADHTMLIFWNHGAGSLGGVSFDEQFRYDSLSLREIQKAIQQAYQENSTKIPLDIVAFDACYMATIDTAKVLQGKANYMVASQAVEPAKGWNYEEWLGRLAAEPDTSPVELGRLLCDSYLKNCEESGIGNEVTLSLTDLSNITPLLSAYNAMGNDALESISLQRDFYVDYSRKAMKAMDFGGNTKTEGYINMVDIASIVNQTRELLPKQYETIQKALSECVLYKVGGKYREGASGLSCYFPLDSNLLNLQRYTMNGSSKPFGIFYQYGVSGNLQEEGYRYIYDNFDPNWQPKEMVPWDEIMKNKKITVAMDENGHATIVLDEKTLRTATLVKFQLAYIDKEKDKVLYLGSDDDIQENWDTGVFKDNFEGIWCSLDGHLVYMELTEQQDNYNIYTVPILLNNVRYNLHVAYDYESKEYVILGARKWENSDVGPAGKSIVELQPGDEITTLFYTTTISGKEEPKICEGEKFTIGKNTTFQEMDLENGLYIQYYQVTDCQGNVIYSDPAVFQVNTDTIDVSVSVFK